MDWLRIPAAYWGTAPGRESGDAAAQEDPHSWHRRQQHHEMSLMLEIAEERREGHAREVMNDAEMFIPDKAIQDQDAPWCPKCRGKMPMKRRHA